MAQHTGTVSLVVSITVAQHHSCPFIKISYQLIILSLVV